MGCVRHDGERVAHVAADDLAHHEDHGEEDGDEELPPRLGHRLLPTQRRVGGKGEGVAVVQRSHLLGRGSVGKEKGVKRRVEALDALPRVDKWRLGIMIELGGDIK